MRQRQALTIMMEGNSVFLTGPPGAGKTYVLNEFIKRAERAGKQVAVTASTGIAATHIGGTTIHSWSGLGIRDVLSEYDLEWLASNDRLVKRYNATDILVIDEVSMLHGTRLDMINQACKLLRQNQAPFGGMQVVLVGDLFQLPPVSRDNTVTDFVHTSKAWEELQPMVCYITEQHRQAGNDGLLELLEAMRRGEVDESHEMLLSDRLERQPDESVAVTRLFAHNVDVDTINHRQLQTLPGTTKTYTMQTKGAEKRVEQLVRSILAPETLTLKKGAEVMFVTNNFNAGFVNGSRGRVIDFAKGMPVVELLTSGRIVHVEPHAWTLQEDGKVRAEAVQLPLRLAWAITIHKSQGMSLDAAEIDLSRSFAPGMGYVALSRVRSLDGVYLRGVNNMALQMHPLIHEFDAVLRAASERLAEATDDITDVAESEASMAQDDELLTSLKQWRSKRATHDKVPPYMVFHDAVLAEIAIRKPSERRALLGIKGFGPAKLEKYGDEIVGIVRSALGMEASGADDDGWKDGDDKLLHELVRQKKSLAEVSKQLGRDKDEIWQRLLDMISET